MKCEICNKEMNGQRGLASHLRQTHDYDTLDKFKEYYDKYILKDDILCPICKKHPKKFIAFNYGYSTTCIGQKDEHGKSLTCRFIWNNKDKEKASIIQKETIKRLKETPSDIDPTKTKFQVKKDNWYNTMLIKDENGKDKFDKIGEKVSINHLSINPLTGKTLASLYAQKAAANNKKLIMEDGRTKHQHISQKSANTVSSIIMFDGRTQKEHMTDKAMDTRKNTILPNGLSILQNTALKAYQTKIENGTLPKYHGYSKISKEIFEYIIHELNLNESRCYYADHEYQLINEIDNTFYRLDFCYLSENKEIKIIIEFNGNSYHLKESELEIRKNDKNPHGSLIIDSYQRDLQKRNFIKNKYPKVYYFEIWEDTIDDNLKTIIAEISNLNL